MKRKQNPSISIFHLFIWTLLLVAGFQIGTNFGKSIKEVSPLFCNYLESHK